MHILLCAATPFEISGTEAFIRDKGLPVSILVTGVGLVAATHALTRAVLIQKPTLLIQAGIGVALRPDLPLSSSVAISSECIGDLGVEEGGKFLSLNALGLQAADHFPWTEGRLPGHEDLLAKSGLPPARGVGVNEISTSPDRMEYYARTLGAEVESMEGAALHFVGRTEKVPFLQVRSLSNFAGERDKGKWKLKESIARLNLDVKELLIKLIES